MADFSRDVKLLCLKMNLAASRTPSLKVSLGTFAI